MLFVVSTPIGNLSDMSYRAVEVLKGVDLIACEDTRRTGVLLKVYGVKNKTASYHDHNKLRQTPKLIGLLKSGRDVALVSDGGTPGISDPGFYLVRECIKEDIKVSPIPGPSAAISSIVCSGLPTDRFSFYGFVPKQQKKRADFFQSLSTRAETAICYESPHRIAKTLKVISDILPDKRLCIARELTKKHEEFIRGTPRELASYVDNNTLRGEIVLLIA